MAAGDLKIIGRDLAQSPYYYEFRAPAVRYDDGNLASGGGNIRKSITLFYRCWTSFLQQVLQQIALGDKAISATGITSKTGTSATIGYGSGWQLVQIIPSSIDSMFSEVAVTYAKTVPKIMEFGLPDGLLYEITNGVLTWKYNGTTIETIDSGRGSAAVGGIELIFKENMRIEWAQRAMDLTFHPLYINYETFVRRYTDPPPGSFASYPLVPVIRDNTEEINSFFGTDGNTFFSAIHNEEGASLTREALDAFSDYYYGPGGIRRSPYPKFIVDERDERNTTDFAFSGEFILCGVSVIHAAITYLDVLELTEYTEYVTTGSATGNIATATGRKEYRYVPPTANEIVSAQPWAWDESTANKIRLKFGGKIIFEWDVSGL